MGGIDYLTSSMSAATAMPDPNLSNHLDKATSCAEYFFHIFIDSSLHRQLFTRFTSSQLSAPVGRAEELSIEDESSNPSSLSVGSGGCITIAS